MSFHLVFWSVTCSVQINKLPVANQIYLNIFGGYNPECNGILTIIFYTQKKII